MDGGTNPASWSTLEVLRWASTCAKLSSETITSLEQNEVDGAILLSLTKDEIRNELKIKSLAGRRYIWDAIEALRQHQKTDDLKVALTVYAQEIQALSTAATIDSQQVDVTVVETLRSDFDIRCQIVQDNILAHRTQGQHLLGQQFYEDAALARTEQHRYDELRIQNEYDHQVAISLADERDRRRVVSQRQEGVKSLFESCIDVCVKNKINVAEALESGQIKVIQHNSLATKPTNTEEDETHDVASEKIDQCSVCYEEGVAGFALPCGHKNCTNCLRQLLRTALRDLSLLPLNCCELPIDTNLFKLLLNEQDAQTLESRVIEMTAKEKMYCTGCNTFINLDYVDVSETVHLSCPSCRLELCAACRTSAHPGQSCTESKAAKDTNGELLRELAAERGWKQCPKCSAFIELAHGCNHMTCIICRHNFCFVCLRDWNRERGRCISNVCPVWDEDRLIADRDARVRVEEEIRGREYRPAERAERIRHHHQALRANEVCRHNWAKVHGYHGACENCGYGLYQYGMVCQRRCRSTVCYTCAHHRLPQRGW